MSDVIRDPIATAPMRLTADKQARLAERLAARGRAHAGRDVITPRTDPSSPAPLSPAQEALWVFEQMHPGTTAYSVVSARRFRAPFDVGALERALSAVVGRHDALRSVISESAEGAVQVVTGTAAMLRVVDLSAVSDGPLAMEAELAAETARPVALRDGPTLRASALVLGPQEFVVVLVAHHIFTDGSSLAIVWRELAAAYDAVRGGRPILLGPAPVQMADVAAWERARMTDDALATWGAAWRERLAGATFSLALPQDAPRTPGPAAARRHVAALPEAVWGAVGETAIRQGVTPFTVVLAAYALLLQRWTGQRDLVVGIPIARRARPELRDVVGYVANMLPVRIGFECGDTFRDVVARVHVEALAALDSEDLPVATLARALGAPAGGDGPLFGTMFSLLDRTAGADAEPAGLEPVATAPDAAKSDLSVTVVPGDRSLEVVFEYRADILSTETVERAATWLRLLISGALQDPSLPVCRLPMVSAEERRTLLEQWGRAPRAVQPSTVTEQVRARAASRGAAVALVADDARLTVAELVERAAALATLLRERGVTRGALVGLVADRSAAAVVAMLAILELGAAYVPIDPGYPVERIRATLRGGGVRHAIVAADHASALADQCEVIPLDAVLSLRPGDTDGASSPHPDDAAVVLFTSGSTGVPKGVVIPHRALVNHMAWMTDVGVREGDVVLHRAPLTFDVSVWETLGVLMHGGRIIVARSGGHADAAYMAHTIAANGVTVVQLTPTVLWALLESPGVAARGSLRMLLVGGEVVSSDLVARVRTMMPGVTMLNCYGPTETTIDATSWRVDGDIADGVVPIGRPMANATAYVLSDAGELQPVGVPGELCIGGAGVAHGYLGDPALTAARFGPDPFSSEPGARMYRTGDRARWRADGQLEFLGRADDQVKLHGVRIELGEVEAALRAHPEIAAAAAAVRANGGAPRLIVFYTTRDGAARDGAALRAWLKDRLPAAMVPAAFVYLDVLPFTSSGKVDRRALPDLPGDTALYVAPDGAVERVVAEVWEAVLGISPVSVTDEFFALGGHSLLATRITGRLNRLFQLTIPLRRFFDAATVRGVASVIVDLEPTPGRADAAARALIRLRDMSPEQRAQLRAAASASPIGPAGP